MPSSAILDVAIGVAFVYLFFSLICSVFNEAIAAIFSLRAKNLVAGINSLFSGATLHGGQPFVQAIYETGLIRGLFQDPPAAENQTTAPAAAAGAAAAPSTAQPSDGPQIVSPDKSLSIPQVLDTAKQRFHVNLPSYIPARAFSSAVVDVLVPSSDGSPRGLSELRESISQLPDGATKNALLSLASSTQKDIEEFQDKIGKWFDDSMDRAAGWYKKKTQRFLLLIGFVVAIGLNVNSIRMAQTLWNNPTARQTTVELAQQYASNHKDDAEAKWQEKAKELSDLGQQLPVPFGWEQSQRETLSSFVTGPRSFISSRGVGSTCWSGIQTLIGWLITALALSLGAPFWFDTLNKFMALRTSPKPAKSPSDGDKN